MDRPSGLYTMVACNSFNADSHTGFTLGNDYHLHANGNFYDDDRKSRSADDFSWKKLKHVTYEEGMDKAEMISGGNIVRDKATSDDFDVAVEEGIDTPRLKVIYHDEEVINQADFNKAMQTIAVATNIPESRLNPSHLKDNPTSEPGVTFIQQVNLDDHKHVSQPEAKVTGAAYEEPEPVDFHKHVKVNPKKARGDAKAPYVFCPEVPVILMNAVMAGGAHKYGPYNFRESKVDAQTYIGGIRRHLALWADGQDKDEESSINHLAHIMANCAILIDTHSSGMMVDNRPKTGLVADILKMVADNHAEYQLENKAHDA